MALAVLLRQTERDAMITLFNNDGL